ncbi:uncharacterized protein LOC142239638 [Haematobia irritans]|uniref:uncharacterized protein LOC142239638 n=1 Tax=Haematobia irritans TaxID=7368 RepID=UPI003F500BE0
MALDSAIALLLLSSNASRIYNESIAKPQMINKTFVIELVRELYEVYKFESFVYYVSERLAYDTETWNDFFRGFWITFPTVPAQMMVTNEQSMKGFLDTQALCLILTTGIDDPIMTLSKNGMKRIRFFKTMFLYFPISNEGDEYLTHYREQNQLYENVQRIYAWIWRKQFTNTLLITVNNNVFVHDPYPTRHVVNVTSNWTRETFFQDYSVDFKGYVINSPIRYDLPRVFYMKGPRYGLGKKMPQISGVSGKLFMVFLDHINARFNRNSTDGHENDAVNVTETIHLIDKKHLEISMNSFTGIIGSNIGNSYPIGINDWCMMVPYRNESPAHLFLKKSFRKFSWFLMCFSVLYITLGVWLCSPPYSRDLGMSFLQGICSILLISPLRVLNVPTVRMRFIFVLLFIMGFFITNLYLTKMASFLTASPELPQINTVDDVVRDQLRIIITNYEYEIMLTKNFSADFMSLMVPVSKAEMDAHRDRFDTSYGYSIQTDRWDFLSLQQKFMHKPLFRLSEICMGPFYHIFPIQGDSHLARPLQRFIMTASQHGLMSHWNNEAFADAWYLDYVHLIVEHKSVVPLSMSFFRSILLVWWFGLILSGLVFCLEVKGLQEWQRLVRVWKRIKDIWSRI